MKIWYLPKHKNLTTGKKILWKRGEIAPIIYIYLLSAVVRLFFPQVCKSDMARYGYLEVFHSPLDFEITRVDCNFVVMSSIGIKRVDYMF